MNLFFTLETLGKTFKIHDSSYRTRTTICSLNNTANCGDYTIDQEKRRQTGKFNMI